MFKTIAYDVESERVEKKSRFIANIFYVESENEAEQKIKEIRKKYFDAKHHCFAYSIYDENQIISRFSDDGEPSGTAGSRARTALSCPSPILRWTARSSSSTAPPRSSSTSWMTPRPSRPS